MGFETAVVGASGYTGAELLRLLHSHPSVSVEHISAQKSAGELLSKVFPAWAGVPGWDRPLDPIDVDRIAEVAEVAFLCLPHGAAMDTAKALVERGVRVIDLSADFRFRDPKAYERWYGTPHRAPELCREAVYGLPERYRDAICGARLVAAPGCYPTSVLLGTLPLLSGDDAVAAKIIADCKSGVSGAGRGLKLESLYCEVDEGIHAYGVASHRHTGEILEELRAAAGRDVRLSFVPHLVPMQRGILATIYAPLLAGASTDSLRESFASFYDGEPFVTVLPDGMEPNPVNVRGTNRAQIAVTADPIGGRAVVRVAIDNLGKGAAGQAVQCFNISKRLAETAGLESAAIFP